MQAKMSIQLTRDDTIAVITRCALVLWILLTLALIGVLSLSADAQPPRPAGHMQTAQVADFPQLDDGSAR